MPISLIQGPFQTSNQPMVTPEPLSLDIDPYKIKASIEKNKKQSSFLLGKRKTDEETPNIVK